MKVIIYEYESTVEHSIPKGKHGDNALKALNTELVGTNKINTLIDWKMVESPKVTNHPNRQKLINARYNLAANYRFNVKVQVYNDGTHTISIIN